MEKRNKIVNNCVPCPRYEKIAKIGQGTFGEVFKARCRTDKNKIVALKKVLMENEKEVMALFKKKIILQV